jgi:hypothetical protein
MPYRYHIVGDSSLTPRHRELLILRTAVNCAASYEWEHHVIRGREAGLSDKEIERVKDGPDAKGWAPAESALLSAAARSHFDRRRVHDDCRHGQHLRCADGRIEQGRRQRQGLAPFFELLNNVPPLLVKKGACPLSMVEKRSLSPFSV